MKPSTESPFPEFCDIILSGLLILMAAALPILIVGTGLFIVFSCEPKPLPPLHPEISTTLPTTVRPSEVISHDKIADETRDIKEIFVITLL